MVWPVGLLFIVVIGIHGEAVMADTQQKFKNRFLLMRHGQVRVVHSLLLDTRVCRL